jgi:hypothetical protein
MTPALPQPTYVVHAPPGRYNATLLGVARTNGLPKALVFSFEVDVGLGRIIRRKYKCRLMGSEQWRLDQILGALNVMRGEEAQGVGLTIGVKLGGTEVSEIECCWRLG